jgi:hypothetical protein
MWFPASRHADGIADHPVELARIHAGLDASAVASQAAAMDAGVSANARGCEPRRSSRFALVNGGTNRYACAP